MLYDSGMAIIVKNAGTAISNFFQSIFPKEDTINTPTIIKAGAVTGAVTTDNNGKKKSDKIKNPAVTNDANPVLAPDATPADDSINDVVVDVPSTAPTVVAIESEINARPARGSLLSF